MTNRQTNGQTDICDCRVAFATEKVGHSNATAIFLDILFNQPYAYHLIINFDFLRICVSSVSYLKLKEIAPLDMI